MGVCKCICVCVSLSLSLWGCLSVSVCVNVSVNVSLSLPPPPNQIYLQNWYSFSILNNTVQGTVCEKLRTWSEQVFEEMVVHRFWKVTSMRKPRRAAAGLCHRRFFLERSDNVIVFRSRCSRDCSAFLRKTYTVYTVWLKFQYGGRWGDGRKPKRGANSIELVYL